MDSDILKVLTELSFDNLFVITGLGFIAVAVLGSIQGKINLNKRSRMASAIVGVALLTSGLVWHYYTHTFRVTSLDVVTPEDPKSSCPTKILLQGVIDTAGSGTLSYDFQVVGRSEDPQETQPETISFGGSDSKVVSYDWPASRSLAEMKVSLRTFGERIKSSEPSDSFNVTCLGNSDGNHASMARNTSAAPSPPPPKPEAPESPQATLAGAAERNIDSVRLETITPAPGTHLGRGQRVTFNVKLQYDLVSADAALLSLSTAQFRPTGGGCLGNGELVDAIEVPITRGRHETQVSITWSGDTGQKSGGRIYGQGYLGFAPMFWASNNGARAGRLRYFGISQDYCYPFGP